MTSPTWPGGPSPNVPMPPLPGSPGVPPGPGTPYGPGGHYGRRPDATPFTSTSAQRAMRSTNWLDAVLFAIASATVAGVLWWAVVATTKLQFTYGALGVGALVGLTTALGARKTGLATAVLAAACTLVALAVAEYFIQRSLAIDEGVRGVPLWDGFGFARDLVKAALDENGFIGLFWGLAVLAAAFTNFRY